MNTVDLGVKEAPTPTAHLLPHAERANPDGVCRGMPEAVSRPRGLGPNPQREREGSRSERRLCRKARGIHNPPDRAHEPDPKGCRRDPGESPEVRSVKEANLKANVRCKPKESLANGAEGRTTDRRAIDWHEVKRTVSNQREHIFRGELLEPCAVRVARTVLRGGRRRDAPSLPDCPRRAWVGSFPLGIG
jgi:hypothetical protein